MNNLEPYIFGTALLCYITAFTLYCINSAFLKEKHYKRARYINFSGFIIASTAIIIRWYNSAFISVSDLIKNISNETFFMKTKLICEEILSYAPFSNMYESLVALSTFTIIACLLITSKDKMPLVEAGVDVVAIIMIGISSLFPSEIRPLVPVLKSYWLPLHVSLAFLGESCFAVAVILSYFYCYKCLKQINKDTTVTNTEKAICFFISDILPVIIIIMIFSIAIYLFKLPDKSSKGIILCIACFIMTVMYILLKTKLGLIICDKLPEIEKLDLLTYNAIKLGYPLFTVGGLIFGMIWANKAWGRYWGWDPKETWALVTFLVYSIYLHAKIVLGKKGVIPAFISIIGFLVTMFTLFGVNFLISGLHSYA